MTSGTYIDDIRLHPTGACSSGVKTGFYYLRTWNGANQATLIRYPQNFRDGFGNIVEWRRPPKRVRKLDDHDYTCTIHSYYDPAVALERSSTIQCQASITWALGGGFSFTDPWTSNDDIALYSKLRKEVEGRDFSAGLMLGTADQSLRTIYESAKRLGKAVDQVKRGNLFGAFTILRGNNNFSYRHRPSQAKIGSMERAILAIRKDRRRRPLKPDELAKHRANDWLELQYGWLPLLSDTYDSGATLGHLLGSKLGRTYRARIWHDGTSGVHTTTPYATITGKITGATRGQIIAHVKEVDELGLMGLKDPASLVWERLPWSFVADWFIPVQSWLSARALASSLVGTFTKTRSYKVVVRGIHYEAAGGYPKLDSPDYYEKRVHVTRTTMFNLPSPPLPAYKPFGEIPSFRRCLNAVSLFIQRVF